MMAPSNDSEKLVEEPISSCGEETHSNHGGENQISSSNDYHLITSGSLPSKKASN
jgi:hypothetical protein